MSVTTYDSSFSYRQDQVAKLGERGNRPAMTADDRQKFQQSPFMQKMKEIDERSWQKFSERDKKRQKTDPSFQPKDADFEAPKAHKYDKSVNYYKGLGVDEYATCDEVKKAYRKLSLAYHPDKQTGKSQEEKDEAALIFMEVKNAYKTLSDDPTRRQYDFERDRDVVSAETVGKKTTEKASFDAAEALLRMLQKAKDNRKAPGEVVSIPVLCRLEKFVFGGHKALTRVRLVKDNTYGGYNDVPRTFRIDIPAGAEQPHAAEFRRQGDHHEEREPDTLRFLFSAKPHPLLDRQGQDLVVREAVSLGGSRLREEPYIAMQTHIHAGRHLLIWGRNPFFRSEASAEEGELQLRLAGLGVGSTGSLVLRLKANLGRLASPQPTGAGPSLPSARGMRPVKEREFLERFGLAPRWGFEASAEQEQHLGGASCPSSAALQRRMQRASQQRPSVEMELKQVGNPVELFTKPYSSLSFFQGSSSSSSTASGSLFAICLSSPPCGKKKAGSDWDRLRARLAPVLQVTGFNLLSQARALRPKMLLRRSVWEDRAQLPRTLRPVPWKLLGDDAFRRGDYWEACGAYARRLEELQVQLPRVRVSDSDEDVDEQDVSLNAAQAEAAPSSGFDLVPEAAKVLSNLAACLLRVGQPSSSLAHARAACRLAPRWARPWSRLGQAAWRVGGGDNNNNSREAAFGGGGLQAEAAASAALQREAVEAFAKSVELEPSSWPGVLALQQALAQLEGPCPEAAHAAKERGNLAVAGGELGLGLATYTRGIAQLPATSSASPEEGAGQRPEQHGLLRGVLFCNRSAVFARLGSWAAAAADAREAVSHQPGLVSAHCQLGVALLGSGQHQEAYVEFAKGMQLDPEHRVALKGRNTCLKELVLWKSNSAKARFTARFWIDQKRPRGSTRVFAVSELHFEQKCNEDWAHAIDDFAFQDDVIVVSGNVADTTVGIIRGLRTLKSKFRRVFYTVGSHEMQIQHSEFAKYPDSFSKLHAIFSACDELGVDVFPAPVCDGVLVAPLLSWCSAEFDQQDPFPDPNAHFHRRSRWPMDADLQVWKYMMKLNEPFLKLPRYETVITFSHFLPRQGLPFDKSRKNAIKAVGCDMIDEQARALGTKLHAFGAGRVRHAQVHAGVRYVSAPLGLEAEWPKDHPPRLMMVYDGKSLCMQEWGADGEPPLGFVKRVLHTVFLPMPGLREIDLRKVKLALQKLEQLPGILASFERLGCRKKDKETLSKEALFPELSGEMSHALTLVAEDLDSLKGLLRSDAYKREWMPAVSPHVRGELLAFCMPLGLDLVTAKKPDPALLLFGLRLGPEVKDDSDEFGKMQKAVEAINKLPGVDGKLSVALQPLGFGRFSHPELLAELGVEDHSAGLTHCFAVLVDEPASFKMLAQSKTYGKWKAAYEPFLSRQPGSLQAFAVPLELAASASAPKKELKKASSANKPRQ
ncbi:unnamed protein product [Polarella glacialis]|uniref:J domain-containing protein n=1 Tax=Polarella glacialis TaxID=89957 RepID=A0A813JGZ7_POLGL|nr:unnamed protein product [Polarella glacialis]